MKIFELLGFKTGQGKTNLALTKAYKSAKKGINTLMVSTEWTEKEIFERYIDMGIDIWCFPESALHVLTIRNVDMNNLDEILSEVIVAYDIKFLVFDCIPCNETFKEFKQWVDILENLHIKVLAYYQKPLF